MMKPKVLISRCLNFESCRYNGGIIAFDLLKVMQPYIDFVTVCPECEIGLGTPRESLRIISIDDNIELVQPAYKNCLTPQMRDYASKVLSENRDIDGFILKGRSPSCGIKDVRIYDGFDSSFVLGKRRGIFADEIYKHFALLPIEEEGRLTNRIIREHFFTQLFMITRFKHQAVENMGALMDFHASNKYLYFVYDVKIKDRLGAIVANHKQLPFNDVCLKYYQQMLKLLSKLPAKQNYHNAFQHIFGYFSNQLNKDEKQYFLSLFQQYQDEKLDKSVIIDLLKFNAIRFDIDYLLKQTIFQPFPDGLIILRDSGIK